MRMIYLDAALCSNLGHHASYCRMIVQEARRLGIPANVFGSAYVNPVVRSELAVVPLFRAYSYDQPERNKDPIAGWLRDFENAKQLSLEDLLRIGPVSQEDVVYVNSVFPALFHSVVAWLNGMSPSQRPRVVIEFGTDPGVQLTAPNSVEFSIEIHDPRQDPRALLYRFAASFLDETLLRSVTLMTFDPFVSSVYQVVIDRPVATFCWPHMSITSIRERQGTRPIKVSVLGHQRTEKGYQFMPQVLRDWLGDQRVTFLIHNAAPEGLRAIQESIRSLACGNPQIVMDETPRDGADWGELLEATDLMLCPYDPIRYASSHSAVMTECLANGIPAVVPRGSVLAAMAARYGRTAVEFSDWSAASISKALKDAIDQFDQLAERAQLAAQKWPHSQGAPRLVKQILELR